MSKKQNVPKGQAQDGRVIYDYQIGNLEGRLLTFLESLGLRETQEKAAKDMFRSIFQESLYRETTYVFGDYLTKAIDESNAFCNVNRVVSGGGILPR